MLSFKKFLTESLEGELKGEGGLPKSLHDFFWHLSAPSLHVDGYDHGPDYHHGQVNIHEGFDQEGLEFLGEGVPQGVTPTVDTPYHPHDIIRAGIRKEIENRRKHNEENEERKSRGEEVKPYPSIRERISQGFHAAFPPGESKAEKLKKGKEARKHFHAFMAKEGNHKEGSNLQFMGQNGKTASSAGDGRNTIGISLAPHTVGTSDPAGRVKCPGHHVDSCPNASSECKKNCLGLTAGGNIQYPNAALRSKVLRQRYLMEHPEHAARLISHEIGENEKWTGDHETIHDKSGKILGYRKKKDGKITSEHKVDYVDAKGKVSKKLEHPDVMAKKIESGEYHTRNIESGVRLNVTSDYKWHKFGDGKLFHAHPKTKFYDYTKNVSSTHEDLPSNYKLALSHTGDNHAESNSHHVVNHLRNGGVAAMVYKRGKGVPQPKRVKVIGSKEGHDEWHVADGDSDDNIDHRHAAAAEHHEKQAEHHESLGNHDEARKHKALADEYRNGKRGVVSGLELKGVSNEKAGKFANDVDKDGTIWLHEHPTHLKHV